MKNKIARSLRNDEVRAYMLQCNLASSQATAVSKICPVNPMFNRQTCHVTGKKFSLRYPHNPNRKDVENIGKELRSRKQKIQNPEWRTNARLCFASLAGGYMLNILDFIGRLISFFPIAILCKVWHRPEGQWVAHLVRIREKNLIGRCIFESPRPPRRVAPMRPRNEVPIQARLFSALRSPHTYMPRLRR